MKHPRIALAVFVALGLACYVVLGLRRTAAAPIFGPPCDDPSTNEQVFVGLYSIYYRAAHVPATPRALGWPPAPLVTAAHYLRCDPETDRRRYRVRYAAIKLATGLVTLQRDAPHAEHAIDEFKDALKELRIPDSLTNELGHPPGSPGYLEDQAGIIIDSKPPGDPLYELQRSCCPCLESCRSGTAAEGIAVVEFTIDVNRKAECLPHVFDPLCWKKVFGDKFFNTDPQVVDGPACTISSATPVPTCRTAQTCNQPLLMAPTPLNMQPAPAAPWCGLLFEDVRVLANGITANAKNVLGVRTTGTPASYRMDYELCEAREWSVTPTIVSGNCAPDIDCGYASVADPGTGNASLSGTKRLRFTSNFPNNANDWAPTALEVLATETATAACVASASCPAANLPASCASTTQGSTPSDEHCKCDKDIDHCDGPFDTFGDPSFGAPLCPGGK